MTAIDDDVPVDTPDTPDAVPSTTRAAALAGRIADEVERAVIGKRDVVDLVLAAVLAGGHVLLEDVPGVAKTLLARSLATACGLRFSRVQFTPDLLPSDITGSLVLDLGTRTPAFRPGPVFTDVLLADEVNRAPAKTQAALLEAMQEGQVTVDGDAHRLGRPFAVVATQNPIEAEGTYPLPEAQLDRFLVRIALGYPGADDELAILRGRLARRQPDVAVEPVVSRSTFVAVQEAVEDVHVDDALVAYALALVRATRDEPDIAVGASPRGSLALVTLARAWALVRGRDYVGPDDIRALAVPTLSHRIALDDDAWMRGTLADDVVRRVIDRVPAPSWS
ncbi:MAG TPA: MoxR family ATPase [Acidimicrobiales bacterium]|nr:MoxR family ATPase [Acidimicrobiales bacterium]